jgi:nuclear pore complex protein Nup50
MAKRGPTSELNHDNWDQDDSDDEDVKGEFQQAAPEELQKRVIRVAKRRSVNTNSPANVRIFLFFYCISILQCK